MTGGSNPKKPLSKRCETAMAEPLDATSDPETVELDPNAVPQVKDASSLAGVLSRGT